MINVCVDHLEGIVPNSPVPSRNVVFIDKIAWIKSNWESVKVKAFDSQFKWERSLELFWVVKISSRKQLVQKRRTSKGTKETQASAHWSKEYG
mgnify:CR=1 FL=1